MPIRAATDSIDRLTGIEHSHDPVFETRPGAIFRGRTYIHNYDGRGGWWNRGSPRKIASREDEQHSRQDQKARGKFLHYSSPAFLSKTSWTKPGPCGNAGSS